MIAVGFDEGTCSELSADLVKAILIGAELFDH